MPELTQQFEQNLKSPTLFHSAENKIQSVIEPFQHSNSLSSLPKYYHYQNFERIISRMFNHPFTTSENPLQSALLAAKTKST